MSHIGPGALVVGVDGSPASRTALNWAVQEARHRGCPVVAILAWHRDIGLMIGPIPVEFGMEWTSERMRKEHQAVLDETVRGCTGPDVRRALTEGDPKSVLIEASRGAVLLVVGTRGGGPIAQAPLGSVSSYCVRHSACPVAVIRAADQESVPAPALSYAGQGQATRSGARRRSRPEVYEVES